jgi:hypothetical protein
MPRIMAATAEAIAAAPDDVRTQSNNEDDF